jgi:hypothetical protein
MQLAGIAARRFSPFSFASLPFDNFAKSVFIQLAVL